MNPDDIFSDPISLEDMLQSKMLDSLSEQALLEIKKIEALDVTDFYEAEIRTFIIDPIMKILGYDKGTKFSVDLGRPIRFLEKNKFPDYQFKLWEENFWLIEAKRPLVDQISFGYSELAQAVEYAAHPSINAALVVLIDGIKIEVFDREVDLEKPLLRVEIIDLLRDFDKLRLLLEPWQVWFFQKRRIIRLLDKVFDKEPNTGRLKEFSDLVGRRLASKRFVVTENFRRLKVLQQSEVSSIFADYPLSDLVNTCMFFEYNDALSKELLDALLTKFNQKKFQTIHEIFPDRPRDANHCYHSYSLAFLSSILNQDKFLDWLPAWLAEGRQNNCPTDLAVKKLLKLCLTLFEDDEPRKIIILAESAFRRIFKVITLSRDHQWDLGKQLHAYVRYFAEELSEIQFRSAPESHLLKRIENLAFKATSEFITSVSDHSGFKIELAKLKLRELWSLEKNLLSGIGDYPKLERERGFWDLFINSNCVIFDLVGHISLCVIKDFPDVKGYAARHFPSEVEFLAFMGSSEAKAMLGRDVRTEFGAPFKSELAKRFFFGDLKTFEALSSAYFPHLK